MSLFAHGVDAEPALLQFLDDADRACALGCPGSEVVIVVVELGAGIGLVGELERLGDVVVADAAAPGRVAQRRRRRSAPR